MNSSEVSKIWIARRYKGHKGGAALFFQMAKRLSILVSFMDYS